MPLDPKDTYHKDIVRSLKTRVPKLLRLNTPEAPRAIIMVTAHWSETNPTISNARKHKLYYDYGGFPPETYKLKYDAPGSPEIAKEVFNALQKVGLKPKNDEERGKISAYATKSNYLTSCQGWDHGVFVPLLLIHHAADIPIIQLSVLSTEDPTQHFLMGQALATLRDSNVAIIGSGFASFHNNQLLFSGISSEPKFQARNVAFSKSITEAILEEDVEQRREKLEQWRKLPNTFEMHPKHGAEHFMPLLVCAGAGGAGKAEMYTDEFMKMDMYSYYWT